MGVERFSLDGKVALVTGSSKNIGKALALGLAECGADIISVARTVPEIEQTAADVRAMGRKAIAIPANVREFEPVQTMVEKAIQEFGRIDVLVNNVGTTFPHRLLDVSERGWDALISINLRATFLVTQAVAKAMVDKGTKGCIINIASTAGYGASPGSPAYGASKAGIMNFTLSCAADLGKHGIRVNCLMPGHIEHEGNIEMFHTDDPEVRKRFEERVPLGRVGELDDLIGPAVFLASDAASFVSGTILIASGGSHERGS
ncbi:SDR family NAD(P)-dependent oxidoreductase [Chloroflexota bacterium]